jgi:hypothetical protein
MLVKLAKVIANTCTLSHVFIDRAFFGGQKRAYLTLPALFFCLHRSITAFCSRMIITPGKFVKDRKEPYEHERRKEAFG